MVKVAGVVIVVAAGAGDGTDRPQEPYGTPGAQERTRRADVWEAAADERERLADERESVADEREWLADERDRLIEQREQELDHLEQVLTAQGMAVEAATALAAAREAVRRAAPGLGRAEEELARARQAAARAEARALRALSSEDRAAAARGLDDVRDTDEQAWLLDRRDFVAAERDRLADERDGSADRRDEAADQREWLADGRDREMLDRERGLRDPGGAGQRAGVSRLTPGAARPGVDQRRVRERNRRADAANRRRAAAEDRQAAAARWGPQAYGPELLRSFSELASHLFVADDYELALGQVLDYAVAVVPGCGGASLTLWRRAGVFDTLATSPAGAKLDHVQFLSGEGPACQAMRHETPVHVPDLAADPRWPELADAAASFGVSEVLCYGLVPQGDGSASSLGALSLFSSSPGAFGQDEREFGVILASYLAVAVVTAQRGEDIDRREAALHRALSSRDVIGQAKGILMERQGLSAPAAFDVLRRASQRLNLRLSDVAEHLAQTGSLPTNAGDASAQPDGTENG